MEELQMEDREAVEEYVAMRMPYVTRQYGAVWDIGNMGQNQFQISEHIVHWRKDLRCLRRCLLGARILPRLLPKLAFPYAK
jgi:hypothetical protein